MTSNRETTGIYPKENDFFKKKFPGLSSPKRMRVIREIVEEFDTNKLKPEYSDSKQDRAMKKILKEMLVR